MEEFKLDLSFDLFEFLTKEIFLFLSSLCLFISVDGLDNNYGGLQR